MLRYGQQVAEVDKHMRMSIGSNLKSIFFRNRVSSSTRCSGLNLAMISGALNPLIFGWANSATLGKPAAEAVVVVASPSLLMVVSFEIALSGSPFSLGGFDILLGLGR